jgi:Asp-tRNA(Asn)/Glu-tRNA(Gln) amidotransferase A subunit family amidase
VYLDYAQKLGCDGTRLLRAGFPFLNRRLARVQVASEQILADICLDPNADDFLRSDVLDRLHAQGIVLHAFLTPSTETAALVLDEVDFSQMPIRFGRFVNILDMCGLALPNGFTGEGMPTSLQIVCRGHEEATALRIGHAYQRENDWHERLPPAVMAQAATSR